jgi:hypothetical protein
MQYRYSVMRHQPSLHRSDRENFAVLVEGRLPTGRTIFIVGTSPDPAVLISSLGKEISGKLPELLKRAITESVQNRHPQQEVLDWLSESLLWNFQISTPQRIQDEDPIHKVAFKLFAEYVAGADQLVDMLADASVRMLRRRESQERLGEIFQTVVQVPEPDVLVAAD